MDLQKVHEDFAQRLPVLGGGDIQGQISGFSNASDDRSMPDRILKVSVSSSARPGQVVLTPEGTHYLLAQHHSSFSARQVYRTLRMIHVDEQLPWTRRSSSTDPVTGLPKGTATPTDLGTIMVSVEPIRLEGEAKMKPESRVRLITGEEIEIGDRIGVYSVLFVEETLGIKIAEAR